MRKQRAERLRFAVESLPPETQRAMLGGIKENRIVTGANTDRRGGLCPMLAADRDAFQVTPVAEIFATAWDHYTGTSFVNVNRRTACDRDLKVLSSMLETSLRLHHAEPPPAARPAPTVTPAPRPELAAATQALTASARLEVIRALEATGHRLPAHAVSSAARPGSARAEQPAPARTPATARTAPGRLMGPAAPGRAPATRTQTDLDRERAREIIANQASTLRSRSWPRPAVSAAKVAPAPELPAARPAPVPAPAPAVVAAPAPRTGDRDQVQEIAARAGWSWLRPSRSYDEFEQTLQDLGETQRGPGSDDGGVRRDDTRRREPSTA